MSGLFEVWRLWTIFPVVCGSGHKGHHNSLTGQRGGVPLGPLLSTRQKTRIMTGFPNLGLEISNFARKGKADLAISFTTYG